VAEIGKAILFRVVTLDVGKRVSSVDYMLPKSQISISRNRVTIADWIWGKCYNCLSFNSLSDDMLIGARSEVEA
jgi:hypothetical protein